MDGHGQFPDEGDNTPAGGDVSAAVGYARIQKYDLWIGIDPRRLGNLAAMFGAASNPTMSMLSNRRGITAGSYLRDQIHVEVALDAPSPDIAQRMLAAYQQKAGAGDGKTWVSVEGSRMQFISIEDAKELKGNAEFDALAAQTIGPQIGPLIQALARMAPQSAATASPKDSPGKIAIQGLDSK